MKYLIAYTPQGIVYESMPASGKMSDKAMVEKSRLVNLFSPGKIHMAYKGFKIQNPLLDWLGEV